MAEKPLLASARGAATERLGLVQQELVDEAREPAPARGLLLQSAHTSLGDRRQVATSCFAKLVLHTLTAAENNCDAMLSWLGGGG
jgi:hypothetical protein